MGDMSPQINQVGLMAELPVYVHCVMDGPCTVFEGYGPVKIAGRAAKRIYHTRRTT